MKNKIVGIYKITSPSGKVYIGQSWNIHARWNNYKYKNQYSRQFPLTNSFMKYGYKEHVFEIVHELPSDVAQDVLNTYEQFYIDSYRDAGFKLMNCKEAGSNGKLSVESRARISAAQIGKRHTEETKKKMSEWQIGKVLSQETKDKIGSANKETVWTEEMRERMSIAMTGMKKPPSHGRNVSKALRGVPKSEDHKAALSKNRIVSGVSKGANNPRAKMTEDKVREIRRKHSAGATLTYLFKEYGLSKSAMHSILQGKNWPGII